MSTTNVPTSEVSGLMEAMPPPQRHPPVPHALYEVSCFKPLLKTTTRSGFCDSCTICRPLAESCELISFCADCSNIESCMALGFAPCPHAYVLNLEKSIAWL